MVRKLVAIAMVGSLACFPMIYRRWTRHREAKSVGTLLPNTLNETIEYFEPTARRMLYSDGSPQEVIEEVWDGQSYFAIVDRNTETFSLVLNGGFTLLQFRLEGGHPPHQLNMNGELILQRKDDVPIRQGWSLAKCQIGSPGVGGGIENVIDPWE